MRMIVTGGAGFIGSALARIAVAQSHDVLVLDKLTYAGNRSSLRDIENNGRFSFRQSDICDNAAMTSALEYFQPDAIFHLAAESHVDRSITGAGAFIETNIVGTFRLLQAARGYWGKLSPAKKDAFRFLHVSTDEVYGSLCDEGLFREDTPYDPRSPYSASKAASDHLASAWHHTYGMPVLISNCSNNYGPYHLPEKLIPLMILNGLDGKNLPVYGDGSNIRDWLYVEDHAVALLTVVQKGQLGRSYNIGGENEATNLELVQKICAILDEKRPGNRPYAEQITFVTDRPGHDQRYAIDPSRISRELGWRPSVTLEEGLEKTIQWFLDHEGWWRALEGRDGVGKRLGQG